MRAPFKYRGPRRGHFLRAWRKRAEITQDVLAERSLISKSNISRIENSKLPYNEDTLEALAAALGLGPADLLTPPEMADAELLRVFDYMTARNRALRASFKLRPKAPSGSRKSRRPRG